jgi:hypothetical protein
MPAPITSPKYQEIYAYIVAFKADHDGCAPSYREIKDACGLSNISMVDYYLNGMVKLGLIKRNGNKGSVRMIAVIGGFWTAPAQSGNGN